MASDSPGVAKALISVAHDQSTFVLFSRKRADNSPEKNGKLELPGGGMDHDDPLAELCRELREEEKSGTLAANASAMRPVPKTFKIAGQPHFLFQLLITFEEYLRVQHSPKESLGFKLVPLDMVHTPGFRERLTPKTRKIFKKIGLGPEF